MSFKVLLTGGGTGGHIYPALAVANRLQELHDDVDILYVGTERGLESRSVPAAGLSFQALEIEGFMRSFNWEGIRYNVRSMYLFTSGLIKARKILKEFQPDVVLGTGGYVSAPICLMASWMKIPTIVHEQNSVLGLTNKMLARAVDKMAISFEDIYEELPNRQDLLTFTGNPRAQEVSSVQPSTYLANLGLDPNKKTVLIVGGSRGAQPINESFIDAYHLFAEANYQVIFVTGAVHYENVKKELERIIPLESVPHLLLKDYIDNMMDVLANVDLIVTRSGATTIAEITALGLPSILIPSPYVTNNHQYKNAKSLVDHGAAELLEEETLNGFNLYHQVNRLMSDVEAHEKMAAASKELGVPDAADRVIQVMLDETKGKI